MKLQSQVVPVFVVRRYHRLQGAGIMASPAVAQVHHPVLAPAQLPAELRLSCQRRKKKKKIWFGKKIYGGRVRFGFLHRINAPSGCTRTPTTQFFGFELRVVSVLVLQQLHWPRDNNGELSRDSLSLTHRAAAHPGGSGSPGTGAPAEGRGPSSHATTGPRCVPAGPCVFPPAADANTTSHVMN